MNEKIIIITTEHVQDEEYIVYAQREISILLLGKLNRVISES